MAAAQSGGSIPPGWALNAATAALLGVMLAFGGPKVAAPIVELLAAGRIGANFFFRVAADAQAKALPSGTGQLLVAVAAVVAQDGMRLPGHRRLASRQG